MDWIQDHYGLTAILIGIVAQYYRSEARQAVMSLFKGLLDVVKNTPRRFDSELSRVKEKIAALRAAGTDKAKQTAALDEVKLAFKPLIRAASGWVEDIGNSAVDAVFAVAPVIVSLWLWNVNRKAK